MMIEDPLELDARETKQWSEILNKHFGELRSSGYFEAVKQLLIGYGYVSFPSSDPEWHNGVLGYWREVVAGYVTRQGSFYTFLRSELPVVERDGDLFEEKARVAAKVLVREYILDLQIDKNV